MFIEPTGEMTLIARRVGVGLLDCCDELKREVMKMLTYIVEQNIIDLPQR